MEFIMEKLDSSSDIFRMALWNIYQHKCFYCQEIIDRLDNMQVDHIIPKKFKLQKYAKEFQDVIIKLKLGDDFEIDSYHNLVPSHSGCNRRKWDILAEKRRTLTFLEDAERNLEKIKNEEKRLGTNINLSRVKYDTTIALRNELDPKIFAQFSTEIIQKLEQLQFQADNKRKAFNWVVFKKRNQEALEYLQSMSLDTLMIEMDVPVNNNLAASKEFFRRLISENRSEQTKMLQILMNYCYNRPHAVFRISTLNILIQIVIDGLIIKKNGNLWNILEEISRLSLNNIEYMKSKKIQNVLCHLDNITTRLGKIISDYVYLKIAELSEKTINEKRSLQEKIKRPFTIADMMINLYNYFGELFWRDFCMSSHAQEIIEGIILLKYLLTLVVKLPYVKWTKGQEPLLLFENYGGTFDMYCYGTWSILRRFKDKITDLDPKIVEFLLHEKVYLYKQIPRLNLPSMDIEKLKEKYIGKHVVSIITFLEDNPEPKL